MADLMRTSNPALNAKAFQGAGVGIGEAMTLQGTVNKTGLLLLCVVARPPGPGMFTCIRGIPQAVVP